MPWRGTAYKKVSCGAFMKKVGGFRRVCLLLWAALACGLLAGCSDMHNIVSGVAAAGEFPVEVAGVTISSRPQKVAVLSPSLADVVLALGYETQLAAGSQECTQASLQDLAKIPGDDAQAVVDVGPDLVLLDPGSSAVAAALEEAGLTVLSIAPATDREDFERLYAQVASALAGGGPGYDAGIKAAQDIFLTLDTINRIVPSDKVTTACYLYDLESRAVTGDMLGSTIMTYSGVTNVFKSQQGGAYDFETLRISNPNAIFCPPGMAEQIQSDSRFQGLQAVQDGKVIEMDPSLMEWQGRTVVETAYEISSTVFPELLEENSMQVADPAEEIESAVGSALASASAEEAADDTQYEALREGDQGEAVLKLQERLDELGYLDTEYDGHFGEYTAQCVSDFQKANGLEETGVADAATQRKLFSRSAKAKGAQEDTSSQPPVSSDPS